MELPPALRQAVDAALEGVALGDLRRASERLSERYRAETRDGRAHIADDIAARAYLAVRMPATYAAIRASLAALAQMRPDFAPHTLLDAGAGPGTALFAAQECWPRLAEATLIESGNTIRAWGERLVAANGIDNVRWLPGNLSSLDGSGLASDLVTLAYVLDELAPPHRVSLVNKLWTATRDMLVVIEPGTPAGWSRILSVRDALIAQGAHIIAPCPHALVCPLAAPDWCHFSRRVARSRMHRQIKSADVPWEDEKFIYLAVSRKPGLPAQARVIAPVTAGGGTVSLKLCRSDGVVARQMLSKRDGAAFRQARRLDWGDVIMSTDSGA